MEPEINRKSESKKNARLLKTDFFKTPFINKLTFFNLSPKIINNINNNINLFNISDDIN